VVKKKVDLRAVTNMFQGDTWIFSAPNPAVMSTDRLVPRILHPWISSYGDLLTITITGRTPRVLLCTCPLDKFIHAFKVVKLFLKS
jgi:hypothetical protein